MCLMHAAHDFIDGLDRGLAKRVDIRIGDLTKVDRAANAILDVMRFRSPLIGFQ
jgi:hypothetical protein